MKIHFSKFTGYVQKCKFPNVVKICETCIGCVLLCVQACPTDMLEMISWYGYNTKQITSVPETYDCVCCMIFKCASQSMILVPNQKLNRLEL